MSRNALLGVAGRRPTRPDDGRASGRVKGGGEGFHLLSRLEVMELLVGDEHTFDLWVQYTAPNGRIKAVRPTLVAWMDMRSRDILGDVICVKANGDTLKESLVKVIYTAGVPKRLLIDNGKDYTKQELTGQNRKKRNIDFDFDAETMGFYQSIGIQGVDRALPYQASS